MTGLLFATGLAAAADLAIVHATILPVSGPPILDGTVVVTDGRIEAVGSGLAPPVGTASVVDATGQYVSPGFIDVHSHMGVYPWPHAKAHGDGNEATAPTTPRVWAGDSVRVMDPAFDRARAGGVTTVQILPGSANLIGGESAVLKLRRSRTLEGLRFVEAPRGIKMACGENPKRVYKADIDGPSTRMGNLAGMRGAFQGALDYRDARAKWRDKPPVDADKEILLDVLDGEIRVHIHCYRHDDIEGIYRVMDEYGVQVASFQHALEAYKVRDIIAAHGTSIATWPDWWGFKLEAYDGIPENARLSLRAGVNVAIHSDSSDTVQRLYTEAAKLLATGLTEAEALETVTLAPARLLGIDDRVGSVEPGKDADLVLLSAHPLDVYTRVSMTWVDGALVYDRDAEGAPDAWP
jgi:imidazolonepropionase-like amidohydrolase